MHLENKRNEYESIIFIEKSTQFFANTTFYLSLSKIIVEEEERRFHWPRNMSISYRSDLINLYSRTRNATLKVCFYWCSYEYVSKRYCYVYRFLIIRQSQRIMLMDISGQCIRILRWHLVFVANISLWFQSVIPMLRCCSFGLLVFSLLAVKIDIP